jgi:hypothetical protein
MEPTTASSCSATNIFKTGLTKLRTLLGENFMAYLKMNLI